MSRKVLVIGIDCASPRLFFDAYLPRMPHTQRLLRQSLWSPLRSTTPPITVPAWSCMVTGMDPGQLGLYGFRNRRSHDSPKLELADGSWVEAPTLWQLLSRRRRRSVVLGLPMTYPVRPILGCLVAGIPLPSGAERWTHPPELAEELDKLAGEPGYMVDVKNFRSDDLDRLGRDLIRLRDGRFNAARALMRRERWELFFMVDMSVDRLHHAFWAHAHPDHVLHDPASPHAGFMQDFYAGLDDRLGEMLETVDEDTALFLVSDHGARSMKGSFRINEWLLGQGDLVLKARPEAAEPLSDDMVDFSRTKAWAAGGYYARIFINAKGREPTGQVEDLAGYRADLKARLQAARGPDGASLGNRVFVAEETYRACRRAAPDLILYPGDLDYRASAIVLPEEGGALFSLENDTGPDGANHDPDGLLIYRPPGGLRQGRRIPDQRLLDLAPTILTLLGLPLPADMAGRPMEALLEEES